MRLLSFDTASACIQICLLDEGRLVVAEFYEPKEDRRQEAATMLMPSIARLLLQHGWRKEELQCLVVGIGPGSFTGIRTACVTARTLACALALPLIGVSAFECFASQVERPVGVILSSQAQFYFAAAYQSNPTGTSEALLVPTYLRASELADKLAMTTRWLASPESLEALSLLAKGLDVPVVFQRLPEIKNMAVIQAQIAWDRLSLRVPGGPGDACRQDLARHYHWSHVEPLYLRGPSVTIKR